MTTSTYRDWNGVLNQLAGLPPGTLDAPGAACVWAGLPVGTLALIGALNYKNHSSGLGLNDVCNQLAGLPPGTLEALAALNHLAGNSPS